MREACYLSQKIKSILLKGNFMENKKRLISDILDVIPDDSDIIIPLANGEPDVILSAIDCNLERFSSLRIHQMLELKDRRYMHGQFPHVKYISYFMGVYARKAFQNGTCELVPNHFHQMTRLLEETTKKPIIVCQATPMDENGYFSLGTQADYAAYFVQKAPFVLQVNHQMPRTYGQNRVHISQVLGYIEVDLPLFEVKSTPVNAIDQQIANFVAERIDNGSTLQVGIGGIPNAVVKLLEHHEHLGIHTEMLTDGMVDLVKKGVVDGSMKTTHAGKIVATFAFGEQKLYEFIHQNEMVEMFSADHTNDPRNIAREDKMVAINATTEVDMYGQCASETVAGQYYSSTGGQADFGAGVQLSKNGKGFICLYSTAKGGTVSRIKTNLSKGSVVTTTKNDVDFVVTEYGVAEMRGKSLSERAKSLIAIAHPNFREELKFQGKKIGLLI